MEGQGVALARGALAAGDIAAGRLVKPFDIAIPTKYAYYVLSPKATSHHPKIVAMIKQAEQLAGKQEHPIIEKASGKMKQLQQSELERLQALAEVNPNIRQEEIDHLRDETSDMQHYLDSTHIKLDALRVAVVVE